MSKKVDWSQNYTPAIPDITQGKGATSKYRNMKEKFQKAYAEMEEQKEIERQYNEILPLMKSLLLVKMTNKTPLVVKRPLPYTTEALGGQEDEDDGFYAINKSAEKLPEFQSVQKVIQPGTELTFIQLEKSMNQLWFKTDSGEEIGIYLEEQGNLMTQTDIYETVVRHLSNGENKE